MLLSFPITLPYYTPSHELPAPLPSATDIALSKHVIPTRRSKRVIVRVGQHYLVKYGSDVALIEGENMLFVRQSCNINIPRVYAIFCDEATRVNYIIMEYVPGESLMSLWETLDSPAKAEVISQVRTDLEKLHQIPSLGYYGTLGRLPFFDEIFMSLEEDPDQQKRICGPFETESQFIEAIVQRYLDKPLRHRAEYLRRVLPSVLQDDDHVPVFTHCDLQRKNIVVRNDGVPFIIDWESAAFYPEYYEYYCAMIAFGHYTDDWHVWVGLMLREYVAELGWLDTIRREVFP